MGEQTSFEELGGYSVLAFKSDVAQFTGRDEEEALDLVGELIDYIPSTNLADPPSIEPIDDKERRSNKLDNIIPDDSKEAYDRHEIINKIVDRGEFYDIFPH